MHGADPKASGFIYIKGAELLESLVGAGEAKVRHLFQFTDEFKKKHGYPAILCFDEIDALLPKRGSGIGSDARDTMVTSFLTEMDGIKKSGTIVIGLTNRLDILDPAAVRDGRFSLLIKIDRPTKEVVTQIFMLNLKKITLSKTDCCSLEELVNFCSDEIFSPNRVLYQIQTGSQGTLNFTLGHVASGSMVKGVVEQAKTLAIRRDIIAKKVGGLHKADLIAAINVIENKNRDINHTDTLKEFVHDFSEDVLNVQKLRQAQR